MGVFKKFLTEQQQLDEMKTFHQLQEGVYDPNIFNAIFLAGGPGSGKSYVVKKTTGGLGMKIVNSDDIYEKDLKNAGLNPGTPDDIDSEQGQAIRLRAKAKAKARKGLWVDGRLGIIIDGTGKDVAKISRQKALLDQLGYQCAMIFANSSLDVAQQRNKDRPRTLSTKKVEKMWNDVQKNMGAFQALFDSKHFIIVDNNDAGEDIFNKVYKRIRGLVTKKPTKIQAKQWIANELRKKNKMENTQFKEYRNIVTEGKTANKGSARVGALSSRSKFSKSLIAKALKIAKKSGGQMTTAWKQIEKIKKGLGDDPEVADALKLANEQKEYDNYQGSPEADPEQSLASLSQGQYSIGLDSEEDQGETFSGCREAIEERKLTDKQLKRRAEIAKNLDDKDLKILFGDDWKAVKRQLAMKPPPLEATIVEATIGGYDASIHRYIVATIGKAGIGFFIDQLTNAMDHYNEREFVSHLNKELKIDKKVLEGVWKNYLKVSPRDQTQWSSQIWKRWLEQQGIVESVEEIKEAYKYKTDHKTYTSAVEEALLVAEKAKYEVDMDDYFNQIATGPRKPAEGKTNRFKIVLSKEGKEQRKKLHIQIYGKGKHGYELNCYIS
jgi:tRNA uridine 5-carbamoylmethylation protein Kti12